MDSIAYNISFINKKLRNMYLYDYRNIVATVYNYDT